MLTTTSTQPLITSSLWVDMGGNVQHRFTDTGLEPIEEEPKFKSNKEYKEWLNSQRDQTDGTKEKQSGV
jgi:hypothetical protein